MVPLTRRQFIGAAAGLSLLGASVARPVAGLTINPRSSWATNRPPKGPLTAEDVKFLIVHHSASRNGHTGADAPAILRSFYDYHTGPKGWNDIAYNFLIDAGGGIWEGRAGSLDGPVAGDATGGNQGFTQLVCVIGDYNTAQPTQASRSSLALLLAWLADRYGVSTAPGAEVTFTSRGSNKWPGGTSVTTPTITGHGTMSQTSCPGANLNAYVVGALMGDVEAVRGGSAPPTTALPTTAGPSSTTTSTSTTTTTVPSTTTTSVSTTTTTVPSTTTVPPTTTGIEPSTSMAPTTVPPTSAPPPSTTLPVAAPPSGAGDSNPLLFGAGALVAVGSGLLIWRYRRMGG